MIILERQMEKSAEELIIGDDNRDVYLPYCQASFNSDGKITLRNHDRANKNKDEIIILSHSETKALFELFSKIRQMNKNYDIPF